MNVLMYFSVNPCSTLVFLSFITASHQLHPLLTSSRIQWLDIKSFHLGMGSTRYPRLCNIQYTGLSLTVAIADVATSHNCSP